LQNSDNDEYFEADDAEEIAQREILAACPFLSEEEKNVIMNSF